MKPPLHSLIAGLDHYSAHLSSVNRFLIWSPIEGLDFSPTHILVAGQAILPTVDLVLALQCANYRNHLPESSSHVEGNFPVVLLALPSLGTFPLLHRYLFTHDAEELLRSLLGIPVPCEYDDEGRFLQPVPALHILSFRLARSCHFGRQAIMNRVLAAEGVRDNVWSLGVSDLDLHRVLDVGFTVIDDAFDFIETLHLLVSESTYLL